MDAGLSSWSPGRTPPPPADAAAGADSAQPGSPATPPAQRPPADDRRPLSPAGSAGGGHGPRTPCGLQPVLEDRTLIADLPVRRPLQLSSALHHPFRFAFRAHGSPSPAGRVRRLA